MSRTIEHLRTLELLLSILEGGTLGALHTWLLVVRILVK